jgi:hypothetical protein
MSFFNFLKSDSPQKKTKNISPHQGAGAIVEFDSEGAILTTKHTTESAFISSVLRTLIYSKVDGATWPDIEYKTIPNSSNLKILLSGPDVLSVLSKMKDLKLLNQNSIKKLSEAEIARQQEEQPIRPNATERAFSHHFVKK